LSFSRFKSEERTPGYPLVGDWAVSRNCLIFGVRNKALAPAGSRNLDLSPCSLVTTLTTSCRHKGIWKGAECLWRYSLVGQNWIGHILSRSCLVKQIIEGKIKGADRSDKKKRKKA